MTMKNVQKWVWLHVMWPLTSIRHPWTRECEVDLWPVMVFCGGLVQAREPGVSSSGIFRRERRGQRNPAEPAEPPHGSHLDRLALRHAAVSLQVSASFSTYQLHYPQCCSHQSESICQQITPKELFSSAHSLSDALFCSCRTQRNTLWLVDSEGAELEEIVLDSEGYCAYSATGTATVTTTTTAVHKPAQPSVCSSMCVVVAGRRGVRELRPPRGLQAAARDGRVPQRLHRRGAGGRGRELRREGVARAGGGACGRPHLPRPRRRTPGSTATRSP